MRAERGFLDCLSTRELENPEVAQLKKKEAKEEEVLGVPIKIEIEGLDVHWGVGGASLCWRSEETENDGQRRRQQKLRLPRNAGAFPNQVHILVLCLFYSTKFTGLLVGAIYSEE